MPGIVSLLRSILLPRRLYAVVGQFSIELIAIGVSGKPTVVLSMAKSSSCWSEAFRAFVAQLQKCRLYYGEPFVILLDVPESTLYAKRYTGALPSEVTETIELLQKDGQSALTTSSIATPNGELFVLQAVRKKYFEELSVAIRETKLPVIGIGTVHTISIQRSVSLYTNSKQVIVMPFGNHAVRTFTDDKGNVVTWTSSVARDTEHLVAVLTEGESSTSNSPKQTNSKGTSAKLARWLSALRRGNVCDSLLLRNLHTTARFSVMTGLNSLRLLSVIFAIILAVSSMTALISANADRGDEETLIEYEKTYDRVVSLAQRNSAVRSDLTSSASQIDTSHWVSPMLSLFCQQRFTSLYLRTITANGITEKSATLEADGLSRSEKSIFELKTFIESTAPTLAVSLATIRPEVVSDGQRVDTLQAFKLVVSSHVK